MRLQNEEHRKISRNLHDSLGQQLANAKMSVDLLGRSDAPKREELLSAALESIERSIAETRTLSCLLHPPLLDEVGFAAAARWYTDEFAKRSGINVQLDLPDTVDRLPELPGIALFRILQESLMNVHRHSGSPAVEIHLQTGHREAVFTVRDFGHGMPPELLEGDGINGGVGLSGMRERVNDLGGTFQVQSDGHGTTIVVTIPLEAEKTQPYRERNIQSSSAA